MTISNAQHTRDNLEGFEIDLEDFLSRATGLSEKMKGVVRYDITDALLLLSLAAERMDVVLDVQLHEEDSPTLREVRKINEGAQA